jgi:CBS domain-containing protein
MTRKTLIPATIQMQALLVEQVPQSVTRDASALTVMTDFQNKQAFRIEPTQSIHDANSKMIMCGVRLLFVTDSQNTLSGLITASDILGEKPLKYMSEHGGRRDEILVKDVMTPVSHLEGVTITALADATVDDVVTMMRDSGRQHMLVVEEGGKSVRGIFSTTQIARQLGEPIELPLRATTFAELGQALAN